MRITGYSHRADFQRVMEINDACYFGDFRPPREIVSDMICISDVLTARVDELEMGSIIGFAIVRNTFQPYIWNIAVDPAWQGRGVGGNLLREIIKRYTLDKCKQITLHVNAQNSAQKLYFDYGFRVIAVEENYFNPDAGLLMKRDLP